MLKSVLTVKKRCPDMSYSISHEDVQMNDASIVIRDSSESFTPSERQIELENMLQGLKDKFSLLSIHYPLRLRILTILPDTWSPKKFPTNLNAIGIMRKNPKI